MLSINPAKTRNTVKSFLHSIYHAHSPEACEQRAVKCFSEDLDPCLTYLKTPETHRRLIRAGNLIERTSGKQKQQTKIIPRFFDEKLCLKLASGSLIRAAERFRRVRMTIMGILRLETRRRER